MKQAIGYLHSVEQVSDKHWRLTSDQQHSLEVYVLDSHIFRFRWDAGEHDFSYAIDPNFQPREVAVTEKKTADFWELHTEEVVCQVAQADMRISLYDRDSQLLLQDALPYEKEGERVRCQKKIQPGESFFGLGDKADDFNLKGKAFENWGTDAFYYQKGSDPLYRNIPFYIGLQGGQAYGLFLDNSYRTHFDFGKKERDILEVAADGGELNYYFFFGPNVQRVAESYVQLTGKPELPPLWGLGYHQCKWSYFPESNVREIAAQFRDLEIPCDAIYLDIDYMDGYRCFTWNREGFPNPDGMVADLNNLGFKTVVILDPGIKIDEDYRMYQEGLKGDFFCKTNDGKVFEGEVWPGPCHFPDFTKPDTREWWKTQIKTLAEAGISGIWNDMNEPSVFDTESQTMTPEVVHDYEGEGSTHARAHNVYGMQMARSTYEGIKKWRPEHRPFVITRSGYSGLQRYTLVWTGDNTSSWEHMWLASIQCQRMSLSGVSFVGSDIGGFIKDSEPELYVRWIQLGAFHPFFRTHSMADKADMAPNLDYELREAIRGGANREPWAFGEEYGLIIKKYISLRYRLLPYFYTAFWQYVKQGTPILRPLIMLEQENNYFAEHAENFAVGDHLIVAPVMQPNASHLRLRLPRGRWYDYWTDTVHEGNQDLNRPVDLATMPIFIRAGAVLPSQPLMQYTHEKPIDQLTLDVYFGEDATTSQLYEDVGDGYEYQAGQYSLKQFKVQGSANNCRITQHLQGSYETEYAIYQIRIHGLPFSVKDVQVDRMVLSYELEENILTFSVVEDFGEINIQ